MNLLAKHFFDYQSFVNLPNKAIQLHKTPPSQSGVESSAQWAPKSMHIAGKNQPALGSRANRHYAKSNSGSPRHGRPSKLEFRKWGDKHGELHVEKKVPHKDAWMEDLQGEFKHFYEYDQAFDTDGVDSAIQHFPTFSQRCFKVGDIEVLVILTLNSRKDLITITIKTIRNFLDSNTRPLLKLQLFENNQLIEERFSNCDSNLDNKNNYLLPYNFNKARQRMTKSVPLLQQPFDCQLLPIEASMLSRPISRGYGKIINAQLHPQLQIFQQSIMPIKLQNIKNLYQQKFLSLKQLNNFIPNLNNNDELKTSSQRQRHYSVSKIQNQNQLLKLKTIKRGQSLTLNYNFLNQQKYLLKQSNQPELFLNRVLHTTTRTNSTTTILSDDCIKKSNLKIFDSKKNISESFMFRTSAKRLQKCHILIQVKKISTLPVTVSPSNNFSLNSKNNIFNKNQTILSKKAEKKPTASEISFNSAKNLIKKSFSENSNLNKLQLVNNLNENSLIKNETKLKTIKKSFFEIDYELKVDKNNQNINQTEHKNLKNQSLINSCLSIDKILNIDCDKNNKKFVDLKQNNENSNLCNNLLTDSSLSELDIPFYSQELDKLSEQLNRLNSNYSNDSANSLTFSEFNEIDNKATLIYCSECTDEENFYNNEESLNCKNNKLNKIANDLTNSNSNKTISDIECENKCLKKVLVGGFIVGPLGSSRGRWHWRQMIQRHGYPVCMWHRLIQITPLLANMMHPLTTDSVVMLEPTI